MILYIKVDFFSSHCFCVSFWCDSCFPSLSPTLVKWQITELRDSYVGSFISVYIFVQFFILSLFFASLFHFSSKKMDTTLEKLKKYFHVKIYRARCEKLRLLMNHGIPKDIHWMIEAKVQLSSESSNSFISYMPGTSKSTFAKKHHAKRL